MQITKQGLWFNHMGDKICLMWFWNPLPNRYFSKKLHCTFSSMKEYKKYMGSPVGVKERNVIGFNYMDLVRTYIGLNFSGEYVIVLTDIDLSKRPSVFWENIPYIKKMAFTNEVVVMRCKDAGQMDTIMVSIEPTFAVAWGFKDGELVSSNDH